MPSLNLPPNPRADAADPAAARTLRLAPIPITPTKPLTPSHVKGLLWVDLLQRATQEIRPVIHELNRTSGDLSCQTLDFWSWLDQTDLALHPAALDDAAIGELYVRYHAEARPIARIANRSLIERVERGWIHPVSARLIEIWKDQYALLGVKDPGLSNTQRLGLGRDDLLAVLARAGLLLDQRHFGGSAFLDLTEQGLPLRSLLDPHGRDNYMLSALRDLVPALRHRQTLALLCDQEIGQDFVLLARALKALGGDAFALSIARVRLPGVGLGSARHGGWEDCTIPRIAARFLTQHGADAFRLGMRLYFIVAQGPGCKEPFRLELLERWIRRARKLIERPQTVSAEAGRARLNLLVAQDGYADPYRVASLLLSPGTEQELRPWIRRLFL